jgi:hypothetical protein
LTPDIPLEKGHAMIGRWDSAWAAIYSVLVTLLMLWWGYVPA